MDVDFNSSGQNLFNVFPETFELQLYKAFHVLKNLGCDYFYFLGMDKGHAYRFCTHENWIDLYHEERFVLNDPLKRITEVSNFLILPWQQVTHLNGNEKRTMYGRISFGLFNGLSMSRSYKNRKYNIALATEIKEHDLARYLMLEKADILERFICECISVFEQYMALIYQPLNLIIQ